MAQQQMTETSQLPAATSVGEVHLTVKDMERALAFYRDILGYTAAEIADGGVQLADGTGNGSFVLHENPAAVPKPGRTSGLFHAAILLPQRRDLARMVKQLVAEGWSIGGASDHGVSEALYLDDADGNGIEIYTDRPRSAWPRNGEQVAMTTQQLDFDSLLGELSTGEPEWTGITDGTTIGHIHLQVGDIERSRHFYTEQLGFETMQDSYPGALFVAAGGYHHHIGMNVWAGRDVPSPPNNAAGMTRFTVTIPGGLSVTDLTARLEADGVPVELIGNESAVVTDPDGIRILLRRG